jgi:hypothetical protein
MHCGTIFQIVSIVISVAHSLDGYSTSVDCEKLDPLAEVKGVDNVTYNYTGVTAIPSVPAYFTTITVFATQEQGLVGMKIAWRIPSFSYTTSRISVAIRSKVDPWAPCLGSFHQGPEFLNVLRYV